MQQIETFFGVECGETPGVKKVTTFPIWPLKQERKKEKEEERN
jgi:hypothetical protein